MIFFFQNNGPPDAQELEAGFNSLALDSEGFSSTKKIWGVEDKHMSDDAKALFIGDSHQWGRDSTWSSAPGSGNANGENGGISEHALSQPIMVKRGNNTYGADGTILSPSSNDIGFIGKKMAESLLNNSPSSKDNLDSRIPSKFLRDHDKVSSQNARVKSEREPSNTSHSTTNGMTNGFGPNEDGIDSNKIFNRTPGIPHQLDDNSAHGKTSVIDGMMIMPGVSHQAPFTDFNSDQLGSGAISNIDGLPSFGNNDYGNHLLPTTTDSPNLIDAYTNNMYQQRTAPGGANQSNNQMSLLASQQQHLGMTAHQNLGPSGPNAAIGHPNASNTGNGNIFPSANQNAPNPYFSDPFMSHMLATAPGPAALAMASQAFYSFPPWNMYPGLMPNANTAGGQIPSQSAHQQVRGANNLSNTSGRPLSPTSVPNPNEQHSASSQALAAIQAQAAASQSGFPMIPLPGTPSGFYDQNSLSALAAAGRGLPSAMHRILPHQMNMMQNPAAIGNGNMRMMPNANQPSGNGQTQANPLFPNNGPNNGNANGMYTSVTNSGIGFNNMHQASGIFSASGHPTGQPLGPQQMGFHNPGIRSVYPLIYPF